VLYVHQGQAKILSIRVFVTLFSEIILYMFIEVLVICLCTVSLIRDTRAYTYSMAVSCLPVTDLIFLESLQSV
jgi:hypothetical protein